jgi:5-enolpyruvylshikimate-3-phosphate synthase
MADIAIDHIDQLRTELGGVVGLPGDSGYEDAVNIWNAAIARRPAVVARCMTSDDVAAALAFARQEGLEVSVRGGGHNYAGCSLCDDSDEGSQRRSRVPQRTMRGRYDVG